MSKGYDSDNVYLTADSHFGHKNVLHYSKRPFESIEEHDEKLIENWNRMVPKSGIVFHLGDIFLNNQQKAIEIMGRLNGQIHLLIGNHDKIATSAGVKNLFAWQKHYHRIKVEDPDAHNGKQDICLMHYPIYSWEKWRYNSYHAFGHCHSRQDMRPHKLCMDVGVDFISSHYGQHDDSVEDKQLLYSPISYQQFKEYMQWKQICADACPKEENFDENFGCLDE